MVIGQPEPEMHAILMGIVALVRKFFASNSFGLYKYLSGFKVLELRRINSAGYQDPEQLCEMYWKRMKKIIQEMNRSGITDNALWNCILHLKNCKIKREWRKWLIQKDEYSNIKMLF
jgi:hypothetical protein